MKGKIGLNHALKDIEKISRYRLVSRYFLMFLNDAIYCFRDISRYKTLNPDLKYEKHEILPLALDALYQPVGRDIPILLVAFVNAVTKSTKRLGNTLGKIMTSKIQKAAWFDQINTNQLISAMSH